MNFTWLLRLLFLVCIVSQIDLVAGVEIPAHQTIAFYETQKQVDHILF